MSRIQYSARSPFQLASSFTKPWVGTLGIWGAGAGTAALLFLSVTPLVRRELLVKVPLLGSFYEDKVPASDKPF
ncbi:ubiquinol-cytochrome-c reductase complex subunit-domain-containing protein [Armillaria luteobubalina]|uniref:Ubiquinol-cytochrome-c reductase complex subunit-domain-containing protein n=1 Tax=Armillaria luteobubalina TaxID=153913 RepID=A0AA39QI53_9AGAR|nr:ubiquinol-cytochrome-c reductase complex subunit-domain-containing protein [Armillaria fumosa]KAK0502816.1 ubiquinol-cytochrome-c reductase complex subunit-domain-containing protein [Armillaria luteobubalina]